MNRFVFHMLSGFTPASLDDECRRRKTNPFILQDSFESFVDLKRNWLQYKKEHGIP